MEIGITFASMPHVIYGIYCDMHSFFVTLIMVFHYALKEKLCMTCAAVDDIFVGRRSWPLTLYSAPATGGL